MKREEINALRRLKQGDISGLETLVYEYQTKALRAAYLITGSKALAEDCVQEAFIQVYRHIGKFDINRPFGPWFLRIVSNNAIKISQRNQQYVSLDESLNSPKAELFTGLKDRMCDPGEQVAAKITSEEIWQVLEQLSPQQREAIVTRYYLDMSEIEMVEHFETPPGTIKWRLYAARQRLRTLLAGS